MRTNLFRTAALAAAVALPFAATAAFAQSSSDLYSQSQANVAAQPATTPAPAYGQPVVPGHGWNHFVHQTPEGVTHYGSEDYGFQGRSSQY